jgi:uroporphyrinogen-III synthase
MNEGRIMPLPLEGRTIALAEGRQLEELAAMVAREGASPLRCPLLSILDNPDAGPVEAWIDELIADRFDLLLVMTGEAVRRLAPAADRMGKLERFTAALRRVPKVSRGPKPIKALRELDITDARVAAAPTTPGVLTTLADEPLAGKTVGYTLYGRDNPELDAFLRDKGTTPRPVLPYVLAPSADVERVVALIERLDAGTIDGIVFTSSPQIDRLYEVARERDLEPALLRGLARTQVAAVGPLVAESLHRHGAHAHVCPDHGWVMKNLVQQIARAGR